MKLQLLKSVPKFILIVSFVSCSNNATKDATFDISEEFDSELGDPTEINFEKLSTKLLNEYGYEDESGSGIGVTASFDNNADEQLKRVVERNIPKSRTELERMRTVFKHHSGKMDAGISVPGFGVKLGKKESSLSAYYIESKVVYDNGDTLVYGVGYSIHYLFKKVKKGLNVSDLHSVSASVQLDNEKTDVLYCIQTYGIHGKDLVPYFKPIVNMKFDVEGFMELQKSINGIHNILAETSASNDVIYKPEIIKFIQPYEL